mmetsp:Transcript_37278/g.64052  ORF Transcript_37278/g.64052 Transcript_37278/m.64052 type:complete len:452 (-) Transcript_37278:8-1363(-)
MAQRKRQRGEESLPQKPTDVDQDVDDLEFEDPYGDEFEEENIITEEELEGMDCDEEEEQVKVWRPNIDQLGPDEILEYDSSAYELYHELNSDWPCLSIDIVQDKLGYQRTKYPHTVYFVAGTQAGDRKQNKIFVFKASELHKTFQDDMDDDDDDFEDDPVLESRYIKHDGCVNRIRVMPQNSKIVASLSDTKSVYLWNISQELNCLDTPQRVPATKPLQTFTGHPDEGYALDWSPVSEGRLLTGDCSKYIYLWNPTNSSWNVDMVPFSAHTDSVEDIQWSPTEDTVFASCSVDKTIRIWDIRKKTQSALSITAHDSDVNVISWNKISNFALLSGGDDGTIKAWDLRKFDSNSPTASFNWHNGPVTSVSWSPFEGTTFAAGSADNQISIWDLSVEPDEDEAKTAEDMNMPPQLLFIHQGQQDPKEIRWHPQIPGMILSTGSNGFGVFKTINS